MPPSTTGDRFDQTARFIPGLDPEGFSAWLFPGFAAKLRFARWLDTRTPSGPASPHQVADTVGDYVGIGEPGPPWLALVEFQTQPDPALPGRLLVELGKFWTEHRPDDLPGSRYQVVPAVVNLTGTRQSQPASLRHEFPAGGYGLRLDVREVFLAEESAGDTLDGVERSEVASCILAFVPLMKNGGDAGIIGCWTPLAGREPSARRRGELGSAAEVLSELTPGFGAWRDALKEWNMRESTVVQEWINVGKQEGRQEGLVEGQLRQARQTLTRLLARKIDPLPAQLAAQIEQASDPAKLEIAIERLVEGAAVDELFR